MSSEDKAPLEGIGGWLAFLAVGQIIGIARLLFGFFQQLGYYGPLVGLPGGVVTIVLEVALNLALIVLAFATAYALFMRKRTFVRLFFYQWLAIPAVFVLDLIIVAATLGAPLATLAGPDDAKILFPFLVTGLWVWYTRKSKRVANTMVN